MTQREREALIFLATALFWAIIAVGTLAKLISEARL
jgi:hypothetical protein